MQGIYADPSFHTFALSGACSLSAQHPPPSLTSTIRKPYLVQFSTHTMSTADQVKEDYHKHAETYSGYNILPAGLFESAIIKTALGDCTGLVILDLGGGSGIHAREAIDAGAQRVDIVDISPEMMQVATDTEKSLGRDGRIRTLEGDAAKPLDHLALGTYDIVMANWLFDHAGSIETLEGMWKNITKHLKPGAKFLGIRGADPKSPSLLDGKYGFLTKNFRDMPGGVAYTVEMRNDPPWEFEGTSLEISFSGSFALHEKYGLEKVSAVPYEDQEMVKEDPEFWRLFLEHPPYAVVQGFKRS